MRLKIRSPWKCFLALLESKLVRIALLAGVAHTVRAQARSQSCPRPGKAIPDFEIGMRGKERGDLLVILGQDGGQRR